MILSFFLAIVGIGGPAFVQAFCWVYNAAALTHVIGGPSVLRRGAPANRSAIGLVVTLGLLRGLGKVEESSRWRCIE